MLIGVGGSGKQSLIRLCSYMRDMTFNQIELTKGYGLSSFQEHMKGLMKTAGIDGRGISFVMTDTQIIMESFIENLNNLLNTGEIPNLMAPEDKDEINNGVRPVCQEKKIIDTIDNIAQLFVNRVRENLHICLCMSPVGETLRVRCRQFPSLVNCCTLDWFGRWPEEALLFVSSEFLKELPDCSKEVVAGLAEMCMKIHTSVEDMSEQFYESLRRRVYTTPKSYLDLISLYTQVLEQKRSEFNTNKNRLAIGLKKLNDTNTNIAELKIKLAEMQPKLKAKNEELAVALEAVNKDKAIADEKEQVVSAEAEIVNKKATEAKAIADDAEADLAAAKPELEAAQQALSKLDKDSIVEIKAFKSPPAGVVFVMECVMVLLGEAKDWNSIKKVLNDVNGFLGRLKKYDVETTSEKVWKKARDGYINKPNFEPGDIRKSSIAAAALCVWAVACSKFQVVTKKVAPKKAKYAEVTAVLKSAQDELKIKLDGVQVIKDQVAKLEAECQAMQDEKEALEFEMDRSTKRMARAEKLVVLLADEGVRWQQTVETIAEEIERLVGNVFISCACISYFGAFTGLYREKLVEKWIEGCLEREIPTSEDFTLVKTMGDPVILRNWGIAGLPSDNVSSENGILTMQAERFALCIDPQQQANRWIKNMEKNNDLKVLKFGPLNFLRDITMAVRNGLPCLVEDVEETIDPAIDPILQKQASMSDAGIMQIRLGDANVDFDENFQFYMTTKMPNPHYIPEICIKVTLINFTVTFDGLQ
jgi:dynein heavy chain